MIHVHQTGRLFIEGDHAGDVQINGWSGAWGIGTFHASPSFATFEPLFEEWSQLMHADSGPISDATANRLREIEHRMYALRCRLWLVETERWRQILILNIDGPMIEWKEGWAGDEIQDQESASAAKM